MSEPTWNSVIQPAGEQHFAMYRGCILEVTRRHAQLSVVGRISSADGPERFSDTCTIDEAKARCVRVADRLADTTDVPRDEMWSKIEAARRGDA